MRTLWGVAAVLLVLMLPVDSLAQTPDPAAQLPPFIPQLTDEDRAAAFPDLGDHHPGHDGGGVNYFLLFDRMEWQRLGSESLFSLESKGWIGGDVSRFWFRLDGEGRTDRLDSGGAHALYGRAITPWWDLLIGIRQDFRPGSPQSWAAVGVQGLAPYWFEVAATVYANPSGDVQLHVATEYDVLITNRLVLQPVLEAALYGYSDADRGIERGLDSPELGLRLRYEIRRELAPYLGVVWHGASSTTSQGHPAEEFAGPRLTLGVRHWF